MNAFTEATLCQVIAELNLECVRHKLMDPRSEYRLSQVEAEESIADYRLFLQEVLDTPGVKHHPLGKADLAWHAHILHMERYEADCLSIFGYVLVHRPNEQGCDDPCNDGKCDTAPPPCGTGPCSDRTRE